MKTIPLLLIFVLLLSPLVTIGEYVDGMVALVEDHIILLSDLRDQYEKTIPEMMRDSLTFERTAPEVLDRMIDETEALYYRCLEK